MATPQTLVQFTTPTTRTDGTSLAAGEIKLYTFTINGTAHTFTPSATQAPGSVLQVPFASMAPAFTPVAGTAYSVAIDDSDEYGTVSGQTTAVNWTQIAAAPNPPSNPTVA